MRSNAAVANRMRLDTGLSARLAARSGAFDAPTSGAVQLMDEHLRQLERNVSLKRSEPERTLAHLLGMA